MTSYQLEERFKELEEYCLNDVKITESLLNCVSTFKQIFNGVVKSFTIYYKDETSYTIKPTNVVVINSEEGKSNRLLTITYSRKPRLELNTDDIVVKEVGDIQQEITMNAHNVLSIEIKQDDRTVEITKF